MEQKITTMFKFRTISLDILLVSKWPTAKGIFTIFCFGSCNLCVEKQAKKKTYLNLVQEMIRDCRRGEFTCAGTHRWRWVFCSHPDRWNRIQCWGNSQHNVLYTVRICFHWLLATFFPCLSSPCGGLRTPRLTAGYWFIAQKTSRIWAALHRQRFAVTSRQKPEICCQSRPGGIGMARRRIRKMVSVLSQEADHIHYVGAVIVLHMWEMWRRIKCPDI